MTATEFYRRAIWTPLLVPFLALPSFVLQYVRYGESLLDIESPYFGKGAFVTFLVASAVVGGIPYLVHLWAIRRLLRNGTEAQLRAASFAAPYKVLPWLCAWCVLLSFWYAIASSMDGNFLSAVYIALLVLSFITCVTGYTYALLTQAQLWLLKKYGWVD